MTLGAPVPSEDAKTAVKTYFTQLEKDMGDPAPVLALPGKDVIPELGKYLARGTPVQQGHAVRLIGLVGRRSSEKEVRTLAVKTLLAYATEEDGGKHAARQALDNLLYFSKADFPPKTDALVEKLVQTDGPRSEALLLAGIVEARGAINDLKALTKVKPDDGGGPFRNPAWSAHLALARLGDADSIRHCLETIEGEKDIVQRVRHFDELVFMRQEGASKVLVRYLMSDAELPDPCPQFPGSKIALYALDVLAKNVEGFPIKSEGGPSYTGAQLATARKWVKDQKELKLKP